MQDEDWQEISPSDFELLVMEFLALMLDFSEEAPDVGHLPLSISMAAIREAYFRSMISDGLEAFQ